MRQRQLQRLVTDANKRLIESNMSWELSTVPADYYYAGVVMANLVYKDNSLPIATSPSIIGIPMSPKYEDVLFDSAPKDTICTVYILDDSCSTATPQTCCINFLSTTALKAGGIDYDSLPSVIKEIYSRDRFCAFIGSISMAISDDRIHTKLNCLPYIQLHSSRDRLIDAAVSFANSKIIHDGLFWQRSIVPVRMLRRSAPLVYLVYSK
jgi:hypothetical protein